MMLSVYNDSRGNNVLLSVDFDENYFPQKYTVSVRGANYMNTNFPGTKRGAEEARRYFRNTVSTFDLKYEAGGVEGDCR